MTTPAVTIQDAIDLAADNIAQLSYDGVASIFSLMTTWVADVFSTSGIFPAALSATDANNRLVADWYGPSQAALEQVQADGLVAGTTGLFATCAVIDMVSRALTAVRDARAGGFITAPQVAATVTAFNTNWT